MYHVMFVFYEFRFMCSGVIIITDKQTHRNTYRQTDHIHAGVFYSRDDDITTIK